jgi:transposase
MHGKVRYGNPWVVIVRASRLLGRYRESHDDHHHPEDAGRPLHHVMGLTRIPGISRTSAETIIAETGGDMSRFPSPAHLASWAGLCPGNHESAGQRRRVGTTNANRWLRPTLLESAPAAARTKGSYVGAQYRQIAHRRGPNKAAVAAAHSPIDVIWHILTTGEPFSDLDADYYQRHRDPERITRRLVHQLEQLGHTVTITPAA